MDTKTEVTIGFYSLGWWIAAGSAYALHDSLWTAFWRAFLSWAYVGFLWAKEMR